MRLLKLLCTVFLTCYFICEFNVPALRAQESKGKPLFSFVQVTDTHIIARKSVDNIVKGIESINLLKPQPKFVVVTGDIINGEKPKESFRLYKSLFFKLKSPFYSVFGNHDSKKELYQEMIGNLNYSFDVYPYHFIVLDNIDRTPPYGDTYSGGFTEETINWLRKHLQSVDRETPIVFFCHASIFRDPSYSKRLPGDCYNYKPVIEMLKPYNVVTWFQGHAHCNDIEKVNGVDYITTGCLSDNRSNSNCPIGYRIVKVYKDSIETVYKSVPKELKPALTTRAKLVLKPYGYGTPVSEWKFDEGSGTIAKDAKENNDGRLTGATWAYDRHGNSANALSFDGNDYVDCGHAANLNTAGEITFSAWVKTNSAQGLIITKGAWGGPNPGCYIGFYKNFLRAQFEDGGKCFAEAKIPADQVSNGDWHHIVTVFNKDCVTLYLDGTVRHVNSASSAFSFQSDKKLQIGHSFKGAIDDIRIYNHALTAGDVNNLYTEEKAEEHLQILKGPYLQRMNSRSVVIMWETNIPAGGYITYGEISYLDTKMVVSPCKIHETTIENLKPETTYRYRVNSKLDDEIVSDSGIFTTAPQRERPFQFTVYGDTRTNPERHKSVIDAMLECQEGKPEFVIHSGDLVANGRVYKQWGTEFFAPASLLMRNIPLWPCLGNHERNAKWYFDFFSLPNNERWYSFDYSNARFIQLDSNIDFRPGSEQFRWLEKELKSCRKYRKFVTLHHPAFTSGPHGVLGEDGKPKEKPIAYQQEFLVPLFEKYGVDMVFSGHDHVYERSKKGDIYYIVSGGGGAPNYGKSVENPYSQIFKSTLHYCLIQIDGRKLHMTVWDSQGNQIASLQISK